MARGNYFIGDDVVMGMDEILGADDDDIFGDDDDEVGDDGTAEILGAAIRKIAKRNPGAASSLAKRLAGARAAGGVIVHNKSPSDLRDQVLPFPTTAITTLASVIITTQPQRKFRGERLVVPSTQAPDFLILDLSIAQEPQFVAPGAVAATIFSEVAVGVRLKGKTANLGALVSLTVQNTNAATRTINASILGTVVM